VFAQCCVFGKQSQLPILCGPSRLRLYSFTYHGHTFFRRYGGNLPSSFSTLLSSALVYSTCPPVSVSGTVYNGGAISWNLFAASTNPIRIDDLQDPSHSTRFRNINLIPIDYPLRARLRGRLTLRGLALRRNPWAFGERASHPLYRYSCQHSHFRYLHGRLPSRFTGLRNAPLPRAVNCTP